MNNEARRSPVVLAAVLLAVMAHAFLVSATHFHRAGLAVGNPAPGVVSAGDHGDTGKTREAGDQHAQCLLCRLQRNLVSDLHRSAPQLAAPQQLTIIRDALPALFASDRSFLVPAGRAPPLA